MNWIVLLVYGIIMLTLGVIIGIVLYNDDDNWRMII